MKHLLASWIGIAVSIAIAVAILPGIEIDWQPLSYAVLAALWGLVNVTLGSLVRIVSTPLRLITLGLFGLVINGGVLIVVAAISDSLSVDGFVSALVAALVISLVNMAFMAFYHRSEAGHDEAKTTHTG